jgi:hypothetical protein
MAFGPIFGALFFGLVCGWFGLMLLAQPTGAGRLAGASLLVLGISLALGLLQSRRWARWAGVACALLLGLLALRSVVLEGRLVDHVLLYSAAATAIALGLPATAGESSFRASAERRGRDLLQAGVALGLIGLIGAGGWWASSAAGERAQLRSELPASAVAQRVRWTDYEQGLERARVEGRPVLATFVTDWCPYCSKMDRNTWRDRAVVDRLSSLVPVRVDAEERQALALRYDVTGFPANLLLDGEGKVISRSDGYLTARQLLSWIDHSIGSAPPSASRAALERERVGS